MIYRRIRASSFLLGALVAAPMASAAAQAGEYIYGGPVERIADHCSGLGQGFVDVGNGICGRASGHIRVGEGAQSAAMRGWTSGGTSNAGLRSSGSTMVPGATATQHLRVRGNLDSYSPFR